MRHPTVESSAMQPCEQVQEPQLTLAEKLKWLQESTCFFAIYINDHRGCYEPLDKFIENHNFFSDIPEEVRLECIKCDQFIFAQCYPDTPIGFHITAHYDFEKVVDMMYEKVANER